MSGVGRVSREPRPPAEPQPSPAAILRWRVRTKVRELLWLPPLPPPTGGAIPAPPRVELALGPCAPGAVVRVVPAALLLTVTGLVGVGGPVVWWIGGVFALLVLLWPHWPAAAGFALVVGVIVLVGGDLLARDPDTGAVDELWRVAVLVAGVHAVIAATALAEHVAWRSLVELGVLWRTARSVLAAQAIVQTLVLLAGWLRAGVGGAESQELVRLLGVIGVIVLALAALPAGWLRREPPGSPSSED